MNDKVNRPEDLTYIKIHNFDDTVTWESSDHEITISGMLDKFIGLLTAIGFNALDVNQCIIDMADEIREKKALENEWEEEVF